MNSLYDLNHGMFMIFCVGVQIAWCSGVEINFEPLIGGVRHRAVSSLKIIVLRCGGIFFI